MASAFSPENQAILDEGLAMGDYCSEDEMILDALRLLCERNARRREIRAQLQTRSDRLDRGEGIEIEDEEGLRQFFDDVQTRGQARWQAAQNSE